MTKTEWEIIQKSWPSDQKDGRTFGLDSERLRVPGGWIVRTVCFIKTYGVTVSQTFINDEKHEWTL